MVDDGVDLKGSCVSRMKGRGCVWTNAPNFGCL